MSFIKKDMSQEQLKDMVISLEAQLVNLYDERAKYGSPEELNSSVESLTNQLQTFYSKQEEFGSLEELATALKGLEEQLATFYHDVEHASYDSASDELKATIHNLEKQVISLIDEKNEIEQLVEEYTSKMHKIKFKSRELGAALFEAALFEEKKAA